MNTDPSAIKVLCFGDSNTHGTTPYPGDRFKANERWTGLLQKQLGEDYYVIEEGLGGRTTDLDHPDPNKPSRNGIVYFKACIDSHSPLDYVVIMLGTNDLKTTYKRIADDVANALRQFPEYIFDYNPRKGYISPKIILLSPVHINNRANKFTQYLSTPGIYDEVSALTSTKLADKIELVADELKCQFFDVATIADTGDDGLHLDIQSHQKLADKLQAMITSI
ncbi:MAG: GDSL-type esterase/lipase family protein [Candidatus Saccharimonadales bacterium]